MPMTVRDGWPTCRMAPILSSFSNGVRSSGTAVISTTCQVRLMQRLSPNFLPLEKWSKQGRGKSAYSSTTSTRQSTRQAHSKTTVAEHLRGPPRRLRQLRWCRTEARAAGCAKRGFALGRRPLLALARRRTDTQALWINRCRSPRARWRSSRSPARSVSSRAAVALVIELRTAVPMDIATTVRSATGPMDHSAVHGLAVRAVWTTTAPTPRANAPSTLAATALLGITSEGSQIHIPVPTAGRAIAARRTRPRNRTGCAIVTRVTAGQTPTTARAFASRPIGAGTRTRPRTTVPDTAALDTLVSAGGVPRWTREEIRSSVHRQRRQAIRLIPPPAVARLHRRHLVAAGAAAATLRQHRRGHDEAPHQASLSSRSQSASCPYSANSACVYSGCSDARADRSQHVTRMRPISSSLSYLLLTTPMTLTCQNESNNGDNRHAYRPA